MLVVLLGAGIAWAALPPGGTFYDDDGTTFEGSIEAIAAAGITRGCNPPANDLYCPDDSVRRGQMAAFLVRAMGYADDGAGDLFTDDDGTTFENDIDRLGTAGVALGCNPPANDEFCPSESVTRGQMAAFLTRALNLTPMNPPPRPTTTTTTTRPRCDPSYPTVCIPPPPPDLNCSDIRHRNFKVVGSDPHRFDGDNDGFGCES